MDDGSWRFNGSATNETSLKPLCLRAEGIAKVSDSRLCRYFAVEDNPEYVTNGPYLSGFNAPASVEWPWYLENERSSFDHLIYLRNTTCLDPTGCTITYAHELRHVVQHELYPKLLEINRALRYYLPDFRPTASEIDLPTEVDANIAAKHVAELVCGQDAVRKFAEGKVKSMRAAGAAAQEAKWRFFLSTPSSTAYEPLGPTLDAVKEYKGRIDFGMNVDSPNWWLGPVLQPWMPPDVP
jgi:hypothetical protein